MMFAGMVLSSCCPLRVCAEATPAGLRRLGEKSATGAHSVTLDQREPSRDNPCPMRRSTVGPLGALSVLLCLGWMPVVSAAQPSLHLEGKGTFSLLDTCSQTSCPAVLNADLNGEPFGQTELHLPISISTAADEFTGCRSVIGRGGRLSDGQYRVTFSGEICDPPIKGLSAPPPFPTPLPPPSPQRMRFAGHSLSGAVQIHVAGVTCAGQDLPAAVGTLTVYGGPIGDPWLFSILGTADSIPLCPLPSP
jgi:hypothetical protein